MNLLLPFVSSLALFACCARSQTPKAPAESPAQGAANELAKELKELFAKEKIELDLEKGTVTVPAIVNAPPDPIEYLLIHKKGKKHEAMFFTESKPSVLNSALLMLGLVPGKNASYKEKNPPPSLEEIEKGADPIVITPPEGQQFWMTVAWTDDQGKPVEYCVEDLIGDLSIQASVRDASFIYLGGRMASLYKGEPEVYIADFEGNLVSLCYLTPDNHIGTMRHDRSRNDENWWLTDKVPAAGKEVRFSFHRQKPELLIAREKRLAEQEKKAMEEEAKSPAPKSGNEVQDGGKR
jgi:hypothetical protein